MLQQHRVVTSPAPEPVDELIYMVNDDVEPAGLQHFRTCMSCNGGARRDGAPLAWLRSFVTLPYVGPSGLRKSVNADRPRWCAELFLKEVVEAIFF